VLTDMEPSCDLQAAQVTQRCMRLPKTLRTLSDIHLAAYRNTSLDDFSQILACCDRPKRTTEDAEWRVWRPWLI
jgi:hypothetical protein